VAIQPLRPFFFAIFCLLACLSPKAQVGARGYSVTHYNSDNALPQNSINGMAFDKNGFLWLATKKGIARFDGKNFREYNTDNCPALQWDAYLLPEREAATDKIIFRPEVDSRQILTVTDDYRIVADSAVAETPENQARSGVRPKLQFVIGDIHFFIDSRTRMYAYRNGVLQKNIRPSRKLARLFIRAAGANSGPGQPSLNVRGDGIHTLMVSRDTILLLRLGGNVLDYTILAAGTSIKDIACILYDEHSQTLYVGSLTSGLYVLQLHDFERLFFDDPRYMANSQFAQIELPDGSILTSTGILNKNNAGNVLFPDTHDFDQLACLQASDGWIWYSEFDSLKKTNCRLQDTVTVKYLGDLLTGIIEREDKEIIYSNPHQLFRRRASQDTILLDTPRLMQHAGIQTIREVSRNNLWIGTSKGLFAYDLSKHLLSRLAGLENASIFVIHIAKDSSIWVGTDGQGFYKYYKGNFIRMPVDSRKSLITAHCFMEDRKGYFWIPTNKGLFRVAKKELDNYAAGSPEKVYYYYVDKSYGFSTNEFNGSCTPCGIKTRDGRFSLPSLDGLVQFNPDSVHVVLPDKPIFIELVTADEKRKLLKDRLVATRDSNGIIFQICSPYFGNKANLHLEYSIKGLYDKWYPVSDDGRLMMTRLDKGEYTLSVRKQDGYAHYTYKTILLTILPYWYETTWFRYISGGLSIGIFLLIFRVRYNYQVMRAQLLEQKVTERTEQLSESNRVKELLIAVILHDLRSPLRFLHLLAQRMYDNYKTTADKNLSQVLLQFQVAANEIYDFTQDFFVFTNMQKEGFVIHREKIVLRHIIDEIVSFYEMGTTIQKNTFINLVPEHIILETDVSLLGLVLRNLADNANKYTTEGEIKIEATQDRSTTRIIMTDAGISMDEQLIARILDKSYNPEKSGQGWGYKIIIEVLARLQGTLSIDASSGKGNKITITFN